MTIDKLIETTEALLAAATPRPWQVCVDSGDLECESGYVLLPGGVSHFTDGDRHLCAHAPEALEQLIAEVRRLRGIETRVAELEDSERFLDALHAAGVDSWEGYEEAKEGGV